ncbi:unnamed protein product, partial [Polarella glacialis]
FNATISACARCGQWQRSLGLLEELRMRVGKARACERTCQDWPVLLLDGGPLTRQRGVETAGAGFTPTDTSETSFSQFLLIGCNSTIAACGVASAWRQ